MVAVVKLAGWVIRADKEVTARDLLLHERHVFGGHRSIACIKLGFGQDLPRCFLDSVCEPLIVDQCRRDTLDCDLRLAAHRRCNPLCDLVDPLQDPLPDPLIECTDRSLQAGFLRDHIEGSSAVKVCHADHRRIERRDVA